MCIFSGPIFSVSQTNIFARELSGDRQILAYGMSLSAGQDLAMILPLPVPPGSAESAVEFIDLSGCPDLFDELQRGFPAPPSFGPPPFGAPLGEQLLAVVQVGSFEASFVPRIADFNRLDPRFRLSTEVWSALPGYASFGFAVFKLRAGEHKVHPMAFAFPRANPAVLFFPTLHIHDGRVHPTARFDHSLFCQWTDRSARGVHQPDRDWRIAASQTKFFVDTRRCRSVVHPDAWCFRREIKGDAENADVYIPV
ncbi:MAG: hypothetical protein ABI193_09750 [Minicystis sp.]